MSMFSSEAFLGAFLFKTSWLRAYCPIDFCLNLHYDSDRMSLENYFRKLIERVENSDEIDNAGKDQNGFYKPRKTIILRNLQLMLDLHQKPLAKEMVKTAWKAVTQELPPEWLILTAEEKIELKKIIS